MARSSKGGGRGGGRKGRGRSGFGSGASRASRPQTKRYYPRTARLNTLLQEIVAGFMERIDDDRIGFVTVTGVEVDNDLNRAEVFISTLEPVETPEAEERFLETLGEYRKPVQAEIAREARIRKTPEVAFSFDPAVRAGARIEEILNSLGDLGSSDDDGDNQSDKPLRGPDHDHDRAAGHDHDGAADDPDHDDDRSG